MISPSAGLILWTVVAVTTFAVIGWLVLVVVPRNLSAFARWAARRRPG
jgi:hypothetical protein